MSIPNICLACLRKDNVLNLFDIYECEGVEEDYGEMLQSCFDITISKTTCTNYMCEDCIMKLRNAYYFKQKVFKNIHRLEKLYTENEITDIGLNGEPNTKNEADNDAWFIVVGNEEHSSNRNMEVTSQKEIEVGPVTGTCRKNTKVPIQNTMSVIIEGSYPDVKHEYPVEIMSHSETVKMSRDAANTTNIKQEVVQKKLNSKERLLEEQTEGIFKCDNCQKTFDNKKTLSRHMYIHMTGPFPCHDCGKLFKKLNSRNAHTWRVHRAAGAYLCGCGHRFATFHARLRHQRDMHQRLPTYDCPYCDNKFYYAGSRTEHVKRKHLHVRNHKCTKCKMAFFKKRELTSHMATVHDIGDKNFTCPVCGKNFYKNSVLRWHMKTHGDTSPSNCVLIVT